MLRNVIELEEMSAFYIYSDDRKTRFLCFKQSMKHATIMRSETLTKAGKWRGSVMGTAKEHFDLDLNKLKGPLFVEANDHTMAQLVKYTGGVFPLYKENF